MQGEQFQIDSVGVVKIDGFPGSLRQMAVIFVIPVFAHDYRGTRAYTAGKLFRKSCLTGPGPARNPDDESLRHKRFEFLVFSFELKSRAITTETQDAEKRSEMGGAHSPAALFFVAAAVVNHSWNQVPVFHYPSKKSWP
jgi:hypothetical protein